MVGRTPEARDESETDDAIGRRTLPSYDYNFVRIILQKKHEEFVAITTQRNNIQIKKTNLV